MVAAVVEAVAAESINLIEKDNPIVRPSLFFSQM